MLKRMERWCEMEGFIEGVKKGGMRGEGIGFRYLILVWWLRDG